jgi:serine palmitoyltransferase
LNKYGCGSCGPRGFYGTIDTHLQLEDAISKFTNTEGAIMYSDGASTCSSTVAAFAKRGDLLVVDEGVYEPLSTGVYLSRANVHWFRHNDMEDLERVLKDLQATDKKLGRKPNAQRRFIVVEGLYKNLGTVAPLDKIVELKHKYHYRLILDESFSFGTLGETGRGALEAYEKRPMYDAEIITIALENSLGSIGGVTVGNEEVVDHQRLSGAGYCFSASAPPFTASAAIASLDLIDQKPEIVHKLQSNIQYMYDQLEAKLTPKLVVTSDTRSPIVVLQLERESIYEAAIMSGIMQECLQRGVAVVATGQDSSSHMRTVLAPCIRMTVSTLHTHEDIDKAIQTLVESAELVASNFPLEATCNVSDKKKKSP